jgi:hypothetical protein
MEEDNNDIEEVEQEDEVEEVVEDEVEDNDITNEEDEDDIQEVDADVDEFDGSKFNRKRPNTSVKKCNPSPKGKPRIHSIYATPTKSGKVRCIKIDTRDIRRNLNGYGKESVLAVKDSIKIKPNRSLAGHIRKYKSPRLAVGRFGSRINQALKTSGGLRKKDFIVNPYGRLVSRKASESAKARFDRKGSDSKRFLRKGQETTLKKLSKRIRKGQEVSDGQLALVETLGQIIKSKKSKSKAKHQATLSILNKKKKKSPKSKQRKTFIPTIPEPVRAITDQDFYDDLMTL